MLLAAVIARISTGIMESDLRAVDPYIGVCDVVIITRWLIVSKMDNISGACTRWDGTVGIGKV